MRAIIFFLAAVLASGLYDFGAVGAGLYGMNRPIGLGGVGSGSSSRMARSSYSKYYSGGSGSFGGGFGSGFGGGFSSFLKKKKDSDSDDKEEKKDKSK